MKILLAVLLLAASTVSAASIVVNGSFENPSIAGDAQFYRVVNAGANAIPGWDVTGTSVDIVHTKGGSAWAQSGSQSLDLAGTPGPGGIAQQVTTVAGQSYRLTFWGSSNGGVMNTLDVSFGGAAVAQDLSTPGLGTWQQYSYVVTAQSNTSTLAFSTSQGGNNGPLLDNVSLTAVPEPATFGLAGAALILAALKLRRRA